MVDWSSEPVWWSYLLGFLADRKDRLNLVLTCKSLYRMVRDMELYEIEIEPVDHPAEDMPALCQAKRMLVRGHAGAELHRAPSLKGMEANLELYNLVRPNSSHLH